MTSHGKQPHLPLKEAVEKALLGLKKSQTDPKYRVLELWADIVGQRIASHTKPQKLRKGKLSVLVDDSGWAFELSTRYRTAILKRLKNALGEEAIEKVYFKVGDLQ